MKLTDIQKEKILTIEKKNWFQIWPDAELRRDPQEKLDTRIEEFKSIIKNLRQWIDFQNKTVLDLGCGFGYFELACPAEVKELVGLEPDSLEASMASELTESQKNCRIIEGVGENIPLPEASIDVIVSFSVLEHVRSIPKVLEECYRVLKPGGVMYFGVPNYLAFRESHYKIFFLPCFPRALAKIYLGFIGKNPKFLDSIHYVTPRYLRDVIQRQGFEIKRDAIEAGLARMDQMISDSNLATRSGKIIRLISKWGLIGFLRQILRRGFFIANDFLIQKPA